MAGMMGPGSQQAQGGYGGSAGGRGGYEDAPLMSNQGPGTPGSYPSQGPGGSPGGYQQGGPSGGYPAAAGPYGDPYGSHQNNTANLKAMSTSHSMNDVFFAAACCIITGSIFGAFALMVNKEFVEMLEMLYLLFFGLILAVLDTPLMKTIKIVMDSKMYIGKYIQFVTRLTGKGITLVFLGSALFLGMWDNLDSGFMEFLAVVLCLVPVAVGLCAIVIGALKSFKLEKVRKQLERVVDQKCETIPHGGGWTMPEFNRQIGEVAAGVKFETQDLKLIFNALVSNPSWRQQVNQHAQGGYSNTNGDDLKIPKQDIIDWCRDGYVLL